MTQNYSAALPIAYVAIRVVIILNWLLFAAILCLLVVLPNERWIMSALDLSPSAGTTRIIWGLRSVAVVGLLAAPLNHVVLSRLLAMVSSVRTGDPFIAANALRLRAIAWSLLGLQLLGLVVVAIGKALSNTGRSFDFESGFSVNGWLAVLLTFVLARVFAEGSLMREDLEATV